MRTSVMGHKLNRQALEYASMAVAGARQKHVVNISCPDGGTSLCRNNFLGFMISSKINWLALCFKSIQNKYPLHHICILKKKKKPKPKLYCFSQWHNEQVRKWIKKKNFSIKNMWFETRSVKYYSNAPSPFTHTVMFYGRKYNFALDNVFTLR